ncbi:hypothetical protein BDN70DRAFT_816721 [Pholiota conissans]|uniref:Uncharacterized protein n=1 Tax=Pholiota conissans TaxID=109636 RepID=A0A9P5YU33_9AGAR|nr:hypothetical protein BDN70DRAFT_816721 [Pholiota conissans]
MLQLNSLTEWSREHIRAVFESPTADEALKAVQATFSTSINVTLNGKQLAYKDIVDMVLRLRKEAPGGLKVQWLQAIDSPSSPDNREGGLGGMYVIRGIYRVQKDYDRPVEIGRHKAVVVRIESQSTSSFIDSRRIVQLSIVASDSPI